MSTAQGALALRNAKVVKHRVQSGQTTITFYSPQHFIFFEWGIRVGRGGRLAWHRCRVLRTL